MQQPQELLTPRNFYQNFLELIEDYEQNKQFDFLKTTPVPEAAPIRVAAPVENNNNVEGDANALGELDWDVRPPAVRPQQSSFGAFWTSVKKAAAKATAYKTAVHSPLIKFVAAEMQDILRQEGEPIKKMTDLTILFHGLHCYVMTATHSKELRDLLETLNRKIWMGTQQIRMQRHGQMLLLRDIEHPHEVRVQGQPQMLREIENPHENEGHPDDRPPVLARQFPPVTYSGPKHLANEADRRLFMTPLENYKAQLRTAIGDVEDHITLPEQEAFIDRYAVQIQRAYELMCHNTTEASKADFREHYKFDVFAKYDPNRTAHLKDPTACYTLITNYDLWHYRVREYGDPRTTLEIDDEIARRRAEGGNLDLQGNSLQRAWAYNQIAVEIMTPRADMGPSYNRTLVMLDREAFNLPQNVINPAPDLAEEMRGDFDQPQGGRLGQ
jgi:hypothetical protein